jgi:hypothetical protein
MGVVFWGIVSEAVVIIGRLQSSIKISYSSSIVRSFCGDGCGNGESVEESTGKVMSSGGSMSIESSLSDSFSNTGEANGVCPVDGDPVGRQLGLKEK